MLPNEIEKLDPRVRRTRQLLLSSFSTLLAERSFANLSVNDITDHAGVNRATFYAHFPDKYILLDTFIREEFRREVEQRVLNACHFSLDNLRLLIVTVCEFVGKTHAHCGPTESQVHSLVETQIRNQVYGLLLHWLEGMQTLERCTVSRERAATAASWAIYGLAHDWSNNKRMPPSEQYAQEVLPLIAANLGLTIELERV
jgi:AcrR family transcriptional regulator